MLEAICYGLASLLAGGFIAVYIPAWGAVVSISIIGVGVIAALNKNR